MKQSLIALAILSLTSITVFAGGPEVVPVAANPFNGAYVGLGIGTAQGDFNTNFNTLGGLTDEEGFFTNQLIYSTKLHEGNVFGEAFLGFGWTWNWLYLGVQGYVDVGRLKATSRDFTPGEESGFNLFNLAQARTNGAEFGIDFQPGFLLTPNTLLHGTFGIAWSRMKLHTFSQLISANDDEVILEINKTRTQSKAVYRIGLGINQMLNQNWSVGMDYIYESYRKIDMFNAVVEPIARPGDVVLNNHTRVKLNANKFLLNIGYHFGA